MERTNRQHEEKVELYQHVLHTSVSSSKLAQTQPPTLQLTFDTVRNPHMALRRDHFCRDPRKHLLKTRENRLFFHGVKGRAFSRWNTVRERRGCPLTVLIFESTNSWKSGPHPHHWTHSILPHLPLRPAGGCQRKTCSWGWRRQSCFPLDSLTSAGCCPGYTLLRTHWTLIHWWCRSHSSEPLPCGGHQRERSVSARDCFWTCLAPRVRWPASGAPEQPYARRDSGWGSAPALWRMPPGSGPCRTGNALWAGFVNERSGSRQSEEEQSCSRSVQSNWRSPRQELQRLTAVGPSGG